MSERPDDKPISESKSDLSYQLLYKEEFRSLVFDLAFA